MLQLAVAGLRTATLVAAVVPGAHFLTEAMENAFQGNEAVHDILQACGKLLESMGDIFAKIGNAIGVDNLSGVGEDKLTGADFTNGFGIIPKVLGNLANHAPDAVKLATDNPTPVIVGGGIALGVAALDPKLAVALHDEGAKGAATVVNVARQASQGAEKAAQFTADNIAPKLPEGGVRNAVAVAANAVKSTSVIMGAQTARLSAQMEDASMGRATAPAM